MFSHWLLMARRHSDMTVSYPAQLSNNTRHMLKPWATLRRLQTNFSLSPEFCISDIQQMLKYPCRLTLKRLDILLQMPAEEKKKKITDEDLELGWDSETTIAEVIWEKKKKRAEMYHSAPQGYREIGPTKAFPAIFETVQTFSWTFYWQYWDIWFKCY